jgi:phosphoglycerate dehydrogenase-like enzyme
LNFDPEIHDCSAYCARVPNMNERVNYDEGVKKWLAEMPADYRHTDGAFDLVYCVNTIIHARHVSVEEQHVRSVLRDASRTVIAYLIRMPVRLLVIADPAARFLGSLSRLPKDVEPVVADDPAQLRVLAPEVDAILYAHGNGSLLSGILPQAGRLRWVHSLWTGVEGIVTPELEVHPALLTNGRGVFRWPLADWVAGVMLMFAFDLRRVIRQQEQGEWKLVFGTMLEGRTLGIVGYGAIGSAAATRARAFGMKIAALRRHPERLQADPLVDQVYGTPQLKELAAASDYLLVATPLTSETRGMIGAAEIAAMKPSSVLINVGRGPVVDEDALTRALQSGQIRGAALDVFSTEPLPAGHPFWGMSNVLVSPHTADRVEGFLAPALQCFFENADRFLKGTALLNVVDKQAGY